MSPLYMCSGNLYAYNPFVDEEKKLWTVYEFNLKKSLLIYIYILRCQDVERRVFEFNLEKPWRVYEFNLEKP